MRGIRRSVSTLALLAIFASPRPASSESTEDRPASARAARPPAQDRTSSALPAASRNPQPQIQPPTAAQSNPVRVVVMSDLNSSYGSVEYGAAVHAATAALVERIHPDLVLIAGDMVAGQKPGLDYRAMWAAFHTSVTNPLLDAGIAIAPAPGNHDASPSFAAERQEYVQQWTSPGKFARLRYVDASHYPLYYSFEHQGVFFAAIDATAVGPLRGNQRAWLDEQLAATDAEVRIVFGHLPNYAFARQREREILDDRQFDGILRRHDVDAYISGHHHAYYPGAVDGVRHVATPCLGGGPRPLIGRSAPSTPAFLVIEIDASGIASLEAVQAPTFEAAVDRTSLPGRIRYAGQAVVRDDLAQLGVDSALPTLVRRD